MENLTTKEKTTTIIQLQRGERFIKFQYRLLCATHHISQTTGEELKLDPYTKLVYMFMRERFNGFKLKGSIYCDNQDYIAQMTGVSCVQVKRIIKLLTQHGVITSELSGAAAGKKLLYRDIKDLDLVVPTEANDYYLSTNLFEEQHEPKPKTATKQPAKAPVKPLSLVPASKPSTPTAPTVAPPVELPVDDVPPSDYDDYNICYEQEEQLPAVRRTKSSHSAPKNTEGHKVERKVVRTEDGSIF